VIERDDPDTAPNYRLLLQIDTEKTLQNQYHIDFRGAMHNHPSGDPTPSRADIDMTHAIIAVAKPLGISVHDHLIVGKHGHASLKGLKLM